ncbi:hypothetical protein PK98_14635 [Croceibacterium mercuriale]|uniref:Uncharacterized protein n=1 Tax=Croceibacterium mercuriale TaxID=1572751 RepID=A0A0B2BX68_9SPHN|nr:hypothetical protein PK98_14635 [Croceibacterium mercuriale]
MEATCQNLEMRWRYDYSWAAFFLANAFVSALIGQSWSQRLLIFFLTAVPVSIWAWAQARKANGS